jgi:hypothetical protein
MPLVTPQSEAGLRLDIPGEQVRIRMVVRCVLASCLALQAGQLLHAQNFSGGYPFPLPGLDTTAQIFLPSFPASAIGSQDFVSVDGAGHFSAGGFPRAFFGVNLAGQSAFPAVSKVALIAGRLRKMGFNLARLHHLDNPWPPYSLFDPSGDTRHLNDAMRDRLEHLIAELKNNGIRVNVNLHVARTFRTADGIAGADSLPEFGKGVTYFDGQLIALQKEYAQQLMTHVNPYTGVSMADDPAIAMVELTNENSLFRFWREGKLRTFAAGGMLMVRHVAMLDSMWNAFLRGTYGTTAVLASAWHAGVSPSDTTNQLRNGSFETPPGLAGWELEQHLPAVAAVSRDSLLPAAGTFAARITVSATDGQDWHVQWKQTGLRIVKDSVYQVIFWARADSVAVLPVVLQRESSPWTWYGGSSVTLSTSWKKFDLTFLAPATNNGDVRLSFAPGLRAGTTWVDDVRMIRLGDAGLTSDESLENGTVRRTEYAACLTSSLPRVRDITAFYLGIQDRYYDDMASYLKNVLHVRVPIVGTNWNAGLPDLASQSRFDYTDNHAYWDHPSFPRVPWSSTDWSIINQPMVTSADGGAIAPLVAGVGVKGKPFTVSEYNHPFPNRYQSEGILFISAYGAFHGVDGVMLFDYNVSAEDWESDVIGGYFSISRNTAMMSLVPSCALAYRRGMIAPSRQPVALRFAREEVLSLPRHDDGTWSGPQYYPRTLSLLHAIRAETYIAGSPADLTALQPPPLPPFVSDTGELTWDPAGLLSVATPKFVGATGLFASNAGKRVGDMVINAATTNGTITWVTLTDDPLVISRRSHVTLSTRSENTGMMWDGTTTIHDKWGTGPTLMAPALVIAKLHIRADSIRVFRLGTRGEPNGTGTLYAPSDSNTFVVLFNQADDKTPWYGIEAWGGGLTASNAAGDAPLPGTYRLDQNFPNPFNPGTTIRYELAANAFVSLRVFDLLGREVATLARGREAAGRHTAYWNAEGNAGGVYFCRLRAAPENAGKVFESTVKLIYVR